MKTTGRHPRWAPLMTGTLILATLTASPAFARPDPGPQPTTTHEAANRDASCPLTRVSTQLVRCDNLTGHNVTAPLWVRQP